jgi:DNA-binding transcriptional regulator YiaG
MPNIASALKEEITRLARKELRIETEKLKKASAAYRSEIAALKRRVDALEKQLVRVSKKSAVKEAPPEATKVRFGAKGLATKRQRLGLSAAELGAILGVSAQTIYNWEAGKSKPRQQQMAAIAALRKMGKKEARAQLASLTA